MKETKFDKEEVIKRERFKKPNKNTFTNFRAEVEHGGIAEHLTRIVILSAIWNSFNNIREMNMAFFSLGWVLDSI